LLTLLINRPNKLDLLRAPVQTY